MWQSAFPAAMLGRAPNGHWQIQVFLVVPFRSRQATPNGMNCLIGSTIELGNSGVASGGTHEAVGVQLPAAVPIKSSDLQKVRVRASASPCPSNPLLPGAISGEVSKDGSTTSGLKCPLLNNGIRRLSDAVAVWCGLIAGAGYPPGQALLSRRYVTR